MNRTSEKPQVGDIIADFLAKQIRSWKFLLFQIIFILYWIISNVFGFKFDPYPFHLLTLILVIETLFIIVISLKSQENQSKIDRHIMYNDYVVDMIIKSDVKKIKASLENDKKPHRVEEDNVK